jgi:hypothetical protein
MNDKETRPIAEPIYYNDGEFIHACESAIMGRGVRLMWTKCDMDVPDDRGFTGVGEALAITCPESLAAMRVVSAPSDRGTRARPSRRDREGRVSRYPSRALPVWPSNFARRSGAWTWSTPSVLTVMASGPTT